MERLGYSFVVRKVTFSHPSLEAPTHLISFFLPLVSCILPLALAGLFCFVGNTKIKQTITRGVSFS